MERLNITSMVLGLIWVVVSYLLITTVMSEWFYAQPIWVIPVTIIGGVIVIRILFNQVFKVDFINKKYHKNQNRRK